MIRVPGFPPGRLPTVEQMADQLIALAEESLTRSDAVALVEAYTVAVKSETRCIYACTHCTPPEDTP